MLRKPILPLLSLFIPLCFASCAADSDLYGEQDDPAYGYQGIAYERAVLSSRRYVEPSYASSGYSGGRYGSSSVPRSGPQVERSYINGRNYTTTRTLGGKYNVDDSHGNRTTFTPRTNGYDVERNNRSMGTLSRRYSDSYEYRGNNGYSATLTPRLGGGYSVNDNRVRMAPIPNLPRSNYSAPYYRGTYSTGGF